MPLKAYPVRRGGTKRMLLSLPVGQSRAGLTPAAKLRLLPKNKDRLEGDEPVAATYTIENFDGDATHGEGWYLKLTAANTTALLPNREYLADAVVTIDATGEPYVSKSWKHPVFEPGNKPT